METHIGFTFKQGNCIDRQEPFLNKLMQRFTLLPPEEVHVALETGTKDRSIDKYHHGLCDSFQVQRWQFKEVCESYLLDPLLFGDLKNLVNHKNPYGKYVPTDPNDKELLAGGWYAQTYNEIITDPKTEFLLPIKIYLNKTGKTASLGSSCGEPVIWSSPLLKCSIRQNARAWRILGYVLSSSAKKQQTSGCRYEKGRNLRNYHKILSAIKDPLIQAQEGGRFYTFV